jgi:Papain family cysteine protease
VPTSLQSIYAFRPYVEKLQALGFDTIEELQAAAQVAGPELRNYLDSDVDSLVTDSGVTMEAIPPLALETISTAEYGLGVDIDAIPRMTVAPPFTILTEESSGCANLVRQMPPIRDQAGRGTCVAFASLAAYEHSLWTTAGVQSDLSEQFLYCNCKLNDGKPQSPGTFLGVAFPLLQRDGCCLEADWPYVPSPKVGNEGQTPFPPGTQLKALTYRMRSFRTLAPTSVADYRNELKSGRAVAFSIPVFNSWYRSTAVAYSGDITMPIPGEVRAGGHAMCIVGCIDLPDKPQIGAGRFIVRNSWGVKWGINCGYGPGYGTIPYAYIARFGSEAYAVG